MDILNELMNQELISKEDIGLDQIITHLRRALKEIRIASQNLEIDLTNAFNNAYLSMLHAGRALMFLYGVRPTTKQQHKTIVRFCKNILGHDYESLIEKFDRMRKLRNKFTYEDPELDISIAEAKSAIATAKEFVQRAQNIIKEKNPQKELKF